MCEPRRLHPLAMLITFIKLLRRAAIPIIGVVVGAFNNFHTLTEFAVLIFVISGAAFVLLFVLPSIVSWYRFTYRVEDGELKIEHGALVKKHRYIRKERIQSVDHSAGVLHRLFGLVKVKIETAGGVKEPEAELSALTFEEARKLENMLYGKTEVSGTNRETAVNARRRLPVFDLFVAGATSGKIGVVLSVLGAIFSQIDTLLPKHFYSNVLRNLVESSLSFIVLLIFAIAVCAWILAILGTMIKYAGFTLSRADHELQISYGLLERRRVTIEIRRIQAVRVVEGMLRQPFGLATVYVESAGGSGGKEEDYSTVLFPLLRKKELPSFFGEFVPDYPGSPKFVPAPKNALPHYVIRQVLFLLVILVPVAIWIPWGVWSLILLPWAAILGAMQYRAAGWATSGEFRVLRFRHLRRMTVFIPRRNIQARERRQSFFQEKSKVATYQVSVMSKRAGKNFRVAYLDERQVRELVKIR